MGRFLASFKRIVAAFAVVAACSVASQAQEVDVDALLAELADPDTRDWQTLERRIRTEWSKSGSASMDLLLQRGQKALEAEEFDVALEHLTALTDHAPDFAEGWHARASAFYEAQLLGPAVADLERALALNPVHYDAIFGLGTILEIIGDETRAYAAYQRVLDLHPHHEEATKAAERLRPGIEGQDI